ncbi:hypothetical protein ANN_23803 [Periplaneta americana]|uniref:Per a allergen n=1 Tax=Periplaneta americana TaxID=6978 RepID=A0ABQ8SP62_PERAM|nr:hypothetical protein ANN_23803 [Periplaneta americana]
MSSELSTESYPAFARIGLRNPTPQINLNQVICPDRGLNPGHVVSRSDALTVIPQGIDIPEIDNEDWVTKLAFLTDVSENMNKLNCRLPGRYHV